MKTMSVKRRGLGLALAANLLLSPAAWAGWFKRAEAAGPPPTGPFAQLTETLRGDITRHPLFDKGPTKVMGMMVVVVRPSGVVYQQAFGRYKGDEVLPIASATKIVSAATIMTLVDAGKLDLDKPIADYLPAAKGKPAGRATMRMLLSHTSGLPGLNQSPKCINNQSGDATLLSCANTILNLPMLATPGQLFAYGGADYQLAGAVVEAITGMSWHAYFRKALAQPCGLSHFSYNKGAPNPRIAGGGYSDVADYAKLLMMFLNDGKCGDTRVLSSASLAALQKDESAGRKIGYAPIAMPPYRYGMGWWIDPASEGGQIYSDPGLLGATPWIDVTHNYGAFILTLAGTKKGVAIQKQIEPVIVEALGKL